MTTEIAPARVEIFDGGQTPVIERTFELGRQVWLEILAEAWRVYPLEACGVVLAVDAEAPIEQFVPIRNAADSSRVFTLDPLQFDKADRAAEKAGLQIVGVVHSHTHTVAYPSPTDRREMVNPLIPPTWHWAIVSLGWGFPELRSFSVWENSPLGIGEESVVLAH
ncbi:MAG: M67 family metallopeptidase [Acidimicrobiales bacterium]